MNKTWFSYVVLSIGLMMLAASDQYATADDKQSAHTVSFGNLQQMEVFVNKEGDEDAQVKLIIDGKTYKFTMPELKDGLDKVITTDDGKEVTIKSVSGNNMIWIDGKEMHLPAFGKHKVAADGLSAMIGRTHQIVLSDDISVSAHGLSDDVKSAIVDAIKGVLTSYAIDKKVTFNSNKFNGLHMLGEDGISGGDGKYEFKIKTEFKDSEGLHIDSDEEEHVIVIKKEEQ